MPHAIMFHHFWNDTHPKGQGAISGEELDQLIDYVGANNILPAAEWANRAKAGTLKETDVALSFDDALKCQADIALPVLEARGITAFWFVYSSVFEGQLERLEIYRYFRTTAFAEIDDFYRAFFAWADDSEYGQTVATGLSDFNPTTYLTGMPYLSENDKKFRFTRDIVLGPERYVEVMDAMISESSSSLTEMAKNLWMREVDLRFLNAQEHIVGLHSYSHPTRIEALSRAEQMNEYSRNYDHLHRVLGVLPRAMSHPCNSYNEDTLDVLSGLGIETAFRANMVCGWKSLMELPRENHANIIKAMNET